MKSYPFTLPDSVVKLGAAILSAASSALRLKPLDTRSVYFQIVVVDRILGYKWSSEIMPIFEHIPLAVLLPWNPSRSIYCRLVVYKSGLALTLSSAKPLPFNFSRKTGVVEIKATPKDLRRLTHNALTSIRNRSRSRVAKTRQVRSSATPRANPESVIADIPWVNYSNGSVSSSGTSPVQVHYREWSGTRTPNYAQVKAMGKLPINPHHVYMYKTQDYGASFSVVDTPPAGSLKQIGAYTRLLGGGWGPTIPSCAHLSSPRNRAIAKLVERSDSGINNIAQDLIQMRQTTDIVFSTVSRITASIHDLRKKDFPGAVRQLWGAKRPVFRHETALHHSKTLAENWLELQYGWKPLLEDVRGVFAGLKRLDLADRSVQTLYASASTESTDRRPLKGVTANVVTGSVVIKTVTRSKFAIRYRVDDHLKAFLAQTGFTNPVNLAWEIIPFSFVVDWFLPIGPFFESISSWNGLVFLDGAETTFTRQLTDIRTYFVGVGYPDLPQQEYQMFGGLRREAIRLDRAKLTAFPSLSHPSFKSPISVTHVLNALALLRAAFSADLKGTYSRHRK